MQLLSKFWNQSLHSGKHDHTTVNAVFLLGIVWHRVQVELHPKMQIKVTNDELRCGGVDWLQGVVVICDITSSINNRKTLVQASSIVSSGSESGGIIVERNDEVGDIGSVAEKLDSLHAVYFP